MENENNQLHMSILNTLSEIKSGLAVNSSETFNIKERVTVIQNDLKEAVGAIKIQNGRVRTLEDWSSNAQKMIENTTKIATETYTNYKTDKTRIWAVIGVLLFLGGTIITLSIMAINGKIKDGINEALSKYGKIEIIE